jgi:hypothetical protein
MRLRWVTTCFGVSAHMQLLEVKHVLLHVAECSGRVVPGHMIRLQESVCCCACWVYSLLQVCCILYTWILHKRMLCCHCWCADPQRRDVVLKTVARGNITMQGPMLLKQGYVGAIPRLAVFIPGVWNVSQFG